MSPCLPLWFLLEEERRAIGFEVVGLIEWKEGEKTLERKDNLLGEWE